MDYTLEVRERLLYPDPDILATIIARMKEDAKNDPWFCSSETWGVPNATIEDEGLEGLIVSPARQECPFLTTKQAAHYLLLSSRTLEKMRMSASGPSFRKHGRYVRYHIRDLESWSKGLGGIANSNKEH
jgi:hypothetical protein